MDGVDIDIYENEVVALIGESGSGKTTMGRLAIKLTKASKGKVFFESKNLEGYETRELWKKAQYIHQDPYSSLDPYLSVREVLERPLGNLLKITDPKERHDIVDDLMNKIGLGYVSTSSKIGQLSGGEKQRILVSRAFLSKPKFVAADEPTTMVRLHTQKRDTRSSPGLQERVQDFDSPHNA